MSKRLKTVVVSLLLVAGLAFTYGIGCTINTGTDTGTTQDLEVVEEVWGIIFRDYVETDKLDSTTLSQAAIKGIVEALDDPYTSYLDAETYKEWSEGIEGKYEGIGAYVGVRDDQIVVIAPIKDSPAERAGIRPGDIILGVNGQSTSEMSLDEVVLQIRGPKGESVSILIQHQDETEPVEIEVVRAEIKLSTVYFEMREDIAYIYIGHFSERTDIDLSSALADLNGHEATGLVLDLRSNPGGAVEAVVDVASHFLKEGVVFYVVDNQGNETEYPVERTDVTTDLPMVVLTDNYSASGSEVLAGALQDYGRATIAGTRTFGKGSVNSLYELDDGSGLLLTTARWFTPDGRLIEGEGIVPDYELELEEDEAVLWAIDYLRSSKK